VRATVVGSGSWGTAFARLLWRNGHEVQVLTLTSAEAVELNSAHANPHFLPGVELSPDVVDAPQSLITEQVAAGVQVRMAVFYELLASRGPSGGGEPKLAKAEAVDPHERSVPR